jgi:hypothetical protein
MPEPSPGLRAIETKYQGVLFRSKLEAKWAVFFDALGLKWEHEPESYTYPGVSGYMPDFLLRWAPGDSGWCWGEVKPDGGDFRKAELLARAANRPVIPLEGPPGDAAPTSRRIVGLLIIELGWDQAAAWRLFNSCVLQVKGHRFWNPRGRGGHPSAASDHFPRRDHD